MGRLARAPREQQLELLRLLAQQQRRADQVRRRLRHDGPGRIRHVVIEQTPADQPLFLYFAPQAPHAPSQPERGDGKFARKIGPFDSAAYMEDDVSDKPAFWRSLSERDSEFLATRQRSFTRQLATLRSVDRQVQSIADALGPRLPNTVFIYTSDNGLAWGEHRYFKKNCEFDVCHRVPLVIRYDPFTYVAPGTDDRPVLNIDLAPTIADLAGLEAIPPVDGRDAAPLVRRDPTVGWRTAVVAEDFGSFFPAQSRIPPTDRSIETFTGDRSGGMLKYVEVCARDDRRVDCRTVEREFYDLSSDPDELCNLLSSAGCGRKPDPDLVLALKRRLHRHLRAPPH